MSSYILTLKIILVSKIRTAYHLYFSCPIRFINFVTTTVTITVTTTVTTAVTTAVTTSVTTAVTTAVATLLYLY